MTNDKKIEGLKPSDFIRMAELSHRSFEERRSYEWKINFGLWAALAVVGYACIREGVHVFFHSWEPYVIGFGLFLVYIIHQIMIARAHKIDKHWKHYYLDRGEGFTLIDRPKPYGRTPRNQQLWWAFAPVVFTGVIIILAIRVLMSS